MNAVAVRLDAAPAARPHHAQLEAGAADTVGQALQVLSGLERADGEDVVTVRGGPARRNSSPEASGMTRIRSSGTCSSSTSSPFVNSEIVITRAAARTTRGTNRRL